MPSYKKDKTNNKMEFFDKNTKIEENVNIEEMEKKYHDKYMIAKNIHQIDGWFYGDIIAVLTPIEYNRLRMPKNKVSKYRIWVGNSLKQEGLGIYGLYF